MILQTYPKKENILSALMASIFFSVLLYLLCIYNGKNIIDYAVGVVGLILFGSSSLFLLYKIIIGYQPIPIVLIIDENGININNNGGYHIKWEDIEFIRKIYTFRDRPPQLSFYFKDYAKRSLMEKRKLNWLYNTNRWFGVGDFNIQYSVFKTDIECVLEEVCKYYKGPIEKDLYIL